MPQIVFTQNVNNNAFLIVHNVILPSWKFTYKYAKNINDDYRQKVIQNISFTLIDESGIGDTRGIKENTYENLNKSVDSEHVQPGPLSLAGKIIYSVVRNSVKEAKKTTRVKGLLSLTLVREIWNNFKFKTFSNQWQVIKTFY